MSFCKEVVEMDPSPDACNKRQNLIWREEVSTIADGDCFS